MRLGLGLDIHAAGRRAFSPAQLPSLAAWWKADAGVTVDTGKVTQWADQSGNARHATQSNEVSRPQYEADHGDGAPAIAQRLSNSEHFEHPAIAAIPAGDFTIYWLMRKNSGDGAVWSQGNAVSTNQRVWLAQVSSNAGQLVAGNDAGNEPTVTTGNTATGWVINVGQRSGNTFSVQLNEGTPATTDFALGASTIDIARIGLLQVGGVQVVALDGWEREGLIYTAAHDAPTIAKVCAYLRRWPSI